MSELLCEVPEDYIGRDFEMIFVSAEGVDGLVWMRHFFCFDPAQLPGIIFGLRNLYGPSTAVLLVHHYPGGPMPATGYSVDGLREFLLENVLFNAGMKEFPDVNEVTGESLDPTAYRPR